MPVTYKIIKKVQVGNTSLALKRREDLSYNCLTWRAIRESNTNRRFYYENNEFWHITPKEAFTVMDKANKNGLFNSQFFRWKMEFKILDSAKMRGVESKQLFDETLTSSGEDQIFHDCDDLRIVACVEPWSVEWRKVMLFSIQKNIITFRSFTKNNPTYGNLYKNFIFNNGWLLDRAMLDADGAICLVHYMALKESFA
jgi:hypothetical protein